MAVGGACLAACCDDVGSSVPTSSTDSSSQQTLPGCGPCAGGVIARHYMVEIEGLGVGDRPGCADSCDDLNGAYVVETTVSDFEVCGGQLVIDGACQDTLGGVCYRQLRLSFVQNDPAGPVSCRVTLGPRSDDTGAGECSAVASIIWEGPVTAPGQKLSCLTLNRLAIPFHSRTGSIDYCDGSAATVYVTAL